MMFPQVISEDVGLYKKTESCFQVSENAMPALKSNRKVPFMATEIVNDELDRLKKSEIIKKVDYSKWMAPIVCTKKKNNNIRLCADFSTGLNICLKTCHRPHPTPEDIFAKLNGGKIFSKLDLFDLYYGLK
ncbi:uncharacterized protein K02A2.6-like [Octopus bimaculoides]|uniref:uncharacterized protein K02A2.6-like n=1 Tax=Octopus bimaculoides TaxID=37653 RepID=UPI00071D9080|nr:uncharacterized protein K02A2.6-like [Octopus bimaculoides]|eukprot:XP_014786330.1 PREDICTED: uncharacterized protein K02A2.6-like [Octopus bimaculoides]